VLHRAIGKSQSPIGIAGWLARLRGLPNGLTDGRRTGVAVRSTPPALLVNPSQRENPNIAVACFPPQKIGLLPPVDQFLKV
jgi:hypothetical protein